MSAITGIGDSLTIVFSASASCSRGTAQRTTSAPASATLRIWSMVAVRLAVSVFVIVWTATGAPPPIGTPPTNIWRFDAICIRVRGGALHPTGPCGRIRPVPSIGPGSRRVRSAVAGLLAMLLAAVLAAPAPASFHLMKIREVHEGGSQADYVELQM